MSQVIQPRWHNLLGAQNVNKKIWPLGALENPLAQPAEIPLACNTLRRVVVPLDGSTWAEHAIPTALALASRAKAALKIVYTYSRSDLIDPSQWHYVAEEFQKRKCEIVRYMKRVAKWASRSTQLPVETLLIESADKKAALINATAGSDLVVMAVQPSGLISRFWSNSAIDALRQRSEVPLLLVHGQPTPPVLSEIPSLKHILVPLDGSVQSECILGPVTMLAKLEHASVVLLHIQQERPQSAFDENGPRERFESVASRYEALAPFINKQVVVTDRWVTDAIATYANQFEIDLVALATRADRGVARFVRGSVMDGLMQRARVPILAQSFRPED